MTMAKKKEYDEGFKESAVRLSYEYANIMKAARELGIPYTLLYNWRKEYPFVRLSLSMKKDDAHHNDDGDN